MNILITGAGLIGSHCARQAVDAGNKVVLFDLSPNRDYLQKVVGKDRADVVAADMRDLPALISAMERYNVDTVVHTAGLIGSRVAENSYTGATNNILGTINVLEASRLRRVRRVVYVSTFGVYDRAKINDSVVRETHPIGGQSHTVTKLCRASRPFLCRQYKLEPTSGQRRFGRGHYVGGSTVGKVMRAPWRLIKAEPFTIDAKTYGPNLCAQQGMDLALPRLPRESQATNLQCRQRRRHRPGDAGTNCSRIDAADGSQGNGCSGTPSDKSAPLDLSTSKAELGYTPRFPLKEALRNYMEELWEEQRS